MTLALVTDTPENPRAVIGGNNPPEPTPREKASAEIEGLFMEAKNWLDGKPIENEEQAAQINRLDELLLKANQAWDKQRAAEKKPFDDAAREVQAFWKPLLDKIALARSTCKQALKPYLEKLEAERQERARLEREEAERKRQEAEAARAAVTDTYDLEAKERAEALAKEAQQAEKAARRVENSKAHVGGGTRARGLRKVYVAKIVDYRAFQRFMAENYTADFKKWLDEQAQRLVNGGFKEIPGVKIEEDTRV